MPPHLGVFPYAMTLCTGLSNHPVHTVQALKPSNELPFECGNTVLVDITDRNGISGMQSYSASLWVFSQEHYLPDFRVFHHHIIVTPVLPTLETPPPCTFTFMVTTSNSLALPLKLRMVLRFPCLQLGLTCSPYADISGGMVSLVWVMSFLWPVSMRSCNWYWFSVWKLTQDWIVIHLWILHMSFIWITLLIRIPSTLSLLTSSFLFCFQVMMMNSHEFISSLVLQ